jgi:hypothetical protein
VIEDGTIYWPLDFIFHLIRDGTDPVKMSTDCDDVEV